MKKMISTFSMPLIILSFLIAGTVDAGTIGATIKGSSNLAVAESNAEKESINTDDDEAAKVHRGPPDESKEEMPPDETISEIDIVEYNGGVYVEVKSNIAEYNGGYVDFSYDCGGPQHQNLPDGERFVLTRDGNYFLDRKTCIEWYTLGWEWNQEVANLDICWSGAQVNYDAAWYACHLMGPDGSQGEWYLPSIYDLESLIVPGKENPATPEGFPGYTDIILNSSAKWSGTTNGYPSHNENAMTKIMYMFDGSEDRASIYIPPNSYSCNNCSEEGAVNRYPVWCVNNHSYEYLDY